MNNFNLIVAISAFVISFISIVLSILHFLNIGYLLNNSYLYASKEQRARMNKRPYYRQSAIIFAIISPIFAIAGLSILLDNYKLQFIEFPLLLGLIVYAIISTIRIRRRF